MNAYGLHLTYALAWVSFGLVHSWLASAGAKDRLAPWLGDWYRLAYNGFATIHIALVWLSGAWLLAGHSSFDLSPMVQGGQTFMYFVGVVVMLAALSGYDLGRFSGLTQIRNKSNNLEKTDIEPLHTGGLHAFVRHPIYTGAYLLLWGGARDDLGLATAIWGSAYLAVGTIFEERYLVRVYGDAYRQYRATVPSIIPWRGKAL